MWLFNIEDGANVNDRTKTVGKNVETYFSQFLPLNGK